MAENTATYAFGAFRLDLAAARLFRDSQEVDLPPKAFQVLAYLIEHRDRLVPKQELVEQIWKDTFVTDDALVQAVATLRRALGDSPEQQHYIRTKARVGYQFVARLHASSVPQGPGPSVSVWVAPISRDRARRLMMLIQVGYLVLYALTLLNLDIAARVLAATLLDLPGLRSLAVPVLVVLALIGVAVRLYVLASVALDHPQTGRQYRRLLPALFLLDELWAFSPLLLGEETGLPVALALIPVLVYAPFAQLTLIRSAYAISPAA